MNRENRLKSRKSLGKVSEIMFPDFASCKRCHISIAVQDFHSTPYSKGSGCFPLCEYCWNDMKPEERLPYYMGLVDSWVLHGGGDYNGVSWEDVRSMISNAVLSGL